MKNLRVKDPEATLQLKSKFLDRIPPRPPQQLLKFLDLLREEDMYEENARVLIKAALTEEEHILAVRKWKVRVSKEVKSFLKARRKRYLKRLEEIKRSDHPDLVIGALASDKDRGYDHLDTLLSPYQVEDEVGVEDVGDSQTEEPSEEPEGWPAPIPRDGRRRRVGNRKRERDDDNEDDEDLGHEQDPYEPVEGVGGEGTSSGMKLRSRKLAKPM